MKSIKLLFLLSIFLFSSEKIALPIAFVSNFKQTLKSPKGKIEIYSGIFRFNSPSDIKWEYSKPIKKDICSNKKFISIVNHDLEQVTFFNGTSFFNFIKVLKNANHYKDNIFTTKLQGVLYTLVVDNKNRLKQILFKDKLDNIINITFLNIKYLSKKNSIKDMDCLFPRRYDIIKD